MRRIPSARRMSSGVNAGGGSRCTRKTPAVVRTSSTIGGAPARSAMAEEACSSIVVGSLLLLRTILQPEDVAGPLTITTSPQMLIGEDPTVERATSAYSHRYFFGFASRSAKLAPDNEPQPPSGA